MFTIRNLKKIEKKYAFQSQNISNEKLFIKTSNQKEEQIKSIRNAFSFYLFMYIMAA